MALPTASKFTNSIKIKVKAVLHRAKVFAFANLYFYTFHVGCVCICNRHLRLVHTDLNIAIRVCENLRIFKSFFLPIVTYI